MKNKMPKTLIDVLKHMYKLGDDFPYSQLSLVMDSNTLFDLMRVFGGQRLYIPTPQEFTRLIQFCLVEEVGSYEEALKINPEALNGFTKSRYDKFADIIYKRVEKPQRKKRNSKRKTKDTDPASGSNPITEPGDN